MKLTKLKICESCHYYQPDDGIEVCHRFNAILDKKIIDKGGCKRFVSKPPLMVLVERLNHVQND